MKLKHVIIIAVLLIILLVSALMIFINNRIDFFNGCIVSNTKTDNFYNNIIANNGSNLIQIDDAIYYNYNNGDCWKYGTYKISSKEVKRIYWNGFQLYPKLPNLNCIVDNKIGIDFFAGLYIDTDSETIHQEDTLQFPEGSYVVFINNDAQYLASDYFLYKFDNNKNKYVIYAASDDLKMNDFYFTSINDFYLLDNTIIYQTRVNDEIFIYCYDLVTETINYRYSLKDISEAENGVDSIIANGDDIFFSVENNTLYYLNCKKGNIENLFHAKGKICVNLYNDIIFIGVNSNTDERGVYTIDLKTSKKAKKINDKCTDNIYILDEKYVYFIDNNCNLFRISIDTNSIEKVFG